VELVTLPPYGEEGAETLRRLRAARPPLFIVLGTPVLMMLAPKEKQRPVVFAMVANPYFSHAAWDPKRPEFHQRNVTGLSSPPPVAQALRQATSLFGPRTWGLLYDPQDGAALEVAQAFERAAGELGLPAVMEKASGPDEDGEALGRLTARGAKVLYLPPATTAARYAPSVLALGRERRVMVVNGHPEITAPGAILTVTLDYEALGREAATLARRVLAGESPAGIPIQETQPLRIQVDESLVRHWAGYPAPGR
jgi:putative ABC transport system substrate-binding protein